MSLLAAFIYTPAGKDAYVLATKLGTALGTQVDLVSIAPGGDHLSINDGTDASYDLVILRQVNTWMDKVIAAYPTEAKVEKGFRFSPSLVDGLNEAARTLGSSLIVMGGGHHAPPKDLTLPVAFAPHGYRNNTDPLPQRISVLVDPEQQADSSAVSFAADMAQSLGADLRIVAIATSDSAAEGSLGSPAIDGETSVEIIRANSVEEAAGNLHWDLGELAVIGSGHLAKQGRFALGSTAAKLLPDIPVPLVLVPRDYSPVVLPPVEEAR